MNPYTTELLLKTHQNALIAEADRARLANEARQASRGNGTPARQPLVWLREAAVSLAARLRTITPVHAGSH